MSPAERFRRCTLAPLLVSRLRDGLTIPCSRPPADAREVEEAAADALEALLAEPAPVAGVSAEERARLREKAESTDPWTRYRAAPLLLAALEAAERDRDAALARVGALSEAEANARRAADLAETMRRDLVAAEARAAQAERERDVRAADDDEHPTWCKSCACSHCYAMRRRTDD